MSPVFVCSIDDGHPLDMKTADLLARHDLAGTFFIPISNREGDAVLDEARIRELGQRFEIGSHTYDHCYLKNVTVWEAYDQINTGKNKLEDCLGMPVNGFCYPGGRYRKRDVELVKACKFTYARTTMNLRFDAGNLPFEIPTTIQFYPHPRDVYLRNFVGSGNRMQRSDGLLLAILHDDFIKRLYAMFDRVCQQGGVFHLWGHSKQIEELQAWDAFDAFLGHVANNLPRTHSLTNEKLACKMVAANAQCNGPAMQSV